MTTDPTPRADRRTWLPLGCLGALALILAVERGIARNPVEGLTSIQWEYRRARAVAEGSVNDCSILAFGDSMLKLGLVPETLRVATGRPAYNFALTATQAPAPYFLLKRAIEAGARPSAVLVEYFPKQLAVAPDFNLDHWPLLLDPAESLALSLGHGDPELFSRLAIRHVLPSVLSTAKIRRRVTQALEGQPNIEREGLLTGVRNWEMNRGYQRNEIPSPPVPVEIWRESYFATRTVHPTNRDYVERFLDLADQHGIPVFWLLPPHQPTMQADCEQTGYDAFHESFVRSFLAGHPELRVIDGRHSNYDPAVFQDPHHLIFPGAQVFSAQVGAVLRRFFDEPRNLASSWVALPSYQVLPPDTTVESLNQSRAALVETGLIRR